MSIFTSRKKSSQFRLKVPKELKLPILLSLLLLLITSLICLIVYTGLQPEIPLFYSLSQPEEQIVPKEFLFILPTLCIIFFSIHLLVMNGIYRIEAKIALIFSWTTVLIMSLFCFALLRILFII